MLPESQKCVSCLGLPVRGYARTKRSVQAELTGIKLRTDPFGAKQDRNKADGTESGDGMYVEEVHERLRPPIRHSLFTLREAGTGAWLPIISAIVERNELSKSDISCRTGAEIGEMNEISRVGTNAGLFLCRSDVCDTGMFVPRKRPETCVKTRKTKAYIETAKRLMDTYELSEGKAEGIIHDLAGRQSDRQLAAKWQESHGRITGMRNMAKLAVADVRAGLITKNLLISNAVLDELHDRVTDPGAIKREKVMTLAAVAKSTADSALNLTQGQVGGGSTINIAIGDIRALQERQKRPSLMERLGPVQEA